MARLSSGAGWAYGSNCDYGSGCGYGVGRGSGAGDGRGNAYDRCLGDGGDEYGIGRNTGDGCGHGMAYGRFRGDGGEGYHDARDYWTAAIDVFSSRWPQLWRERLAAARARGAVIAYWRSDALARPCNGGYGDPVHPGKFERNSGPLRLCAGGTLHATLLPPAYRGERCWIVAMYGETVQDGEKIGALRREIIGEVL
jgi:hypothetical protein